MTEHADWATNTGWTNRIEAAIERYGENSYQHRRVAEAMLRDWREQMDVDGQKPHRQTTAINRSRRCINR